MACGGSEMGPTDADEGGAMEAIGTAALTEEMLQLKPRHVNILLLGSAIWPVDMHT